MHAVVGPVARTVMVAMPVIVTMSAMSVPGMPTAVGGVEMRASEVEIVTVWVTAVDAEVPVACLPV